MDHHVNTNRSIYDELPSITSIIFTTDTPPSYRPACSTPGSLQWRQDAELTRMAELEAAPEGHQTVSAAANPG